MRVHAEPMALEGLPCIREAPGMELEVVVGWKPGEHGSSLPRDNCFQLLGLGLSGLGTFTQVCWAAPLLASWSGWAFGYGLSPAWGPLPEGQGQCVICSCCAPAGPIWLSIRREPSTRPPCGVRGGQRLPECWRVCASRWARGAALICGVSRGWCPWGGVSFLICFPVPAVPCRQ